MYKELLNLDSKLALSGSHALVLQGFKIGRDPKDIDIFNWGGEFKFDVPGLSLKENDFNLPPSRISDDVLRQTYSYHEKSIDIFTCLIDSERANLIAHIDKWSGIKCVHWKDIIAYKLKYSFDNSESAEKHRTDLAFIFTNNTRDNIISPDFELPF